jgi:hypothetical protein
MKKKKTKNKISCSCGAYIPVVKVSLAYEKGLACRHYCFFPGETEKPCVLELMDDTLYEEVEELRLVLGTPQSSSPFGAAVGEQNETLIRIQDDADSKNSLL